MIHKTEKAIEITIKREVIEEIHAQIEVKRDGIETRQ